MRRGEERKEKEERREKRREEGGERRGERRRERERMKTENAGDFSLIAHIHCTFPFGYSRIDPSSCNKQHAE